jgi:hypothetical protein
MDYQSIRGSFQTGFIAVTTRHESILLQKTSYMNVKKIVAARPQGEKLAY